MKYLLLLTALLIALSSCKKENSNHVVTNLSITVGGTPPFTIQVSTSPDSVTYTSLLDTTISNDTTYTYKLHANVGTYLRLDAHDLPQQHLGFEVIYNNTILNDQPPYMNTGIMEMTYNHRLPN